MNGQLKVIFISILLMIKYLSSIHNIFLNNQHPKIIEKLYMNLIKKIKEYYQHYYYLCP